jgi:hypothetical protein
VPEIFAGWLGEHDFDLAGWAFTFANKSAMGVEAGWNDAAVVENEQVSGVELVAELRKMRIIE